MAASVFTSDLYHRLFPVGDIGKLFTDSAEVRAMLLVEGALAKVQGELGVIPQDSAAYIHRSCMEVQIDPGNLSKATGQNGVPVPALVAAFRKEMQAPEHAQYVHWGATSQDIMDTAQMLRLRQMLNHMETGLRSLLTALADLSERHAALPMAGRTYGQHATPTSFGATVAHWGAPLLDLLAGMEGLRSRVLWVSLSGAAGTSAALGPQAATTRASLAQALGLIDPKRSWHSDRSPILTLCAWLTQLATALGKMAEDQLLMTQTDLNELTLATSGGSSTMPQKQNPVQPAAIAALARQTIGVNAIVQGAGLHRQDRDGAAWFTEWLSLPQLCLCAAATLETSTQLIPCLSPNPIAMARALADQHGQIHAEALSFELARHMPRPDAQAAVKTLCAQAIDTHTALKDLAQAQFPEASLDAIFDPEHQIGTAAQDARAFAARVNAL
ncbi:MAG: adenylosuccinate lyase family protein [Thalassovita sp.]